MTTRHEAFRLLFHDGTTHWKKWVLTWGYTAVIALLFVIFYEHMSVFEEVTFSRIALDLYHLAYVPLFAVPFMDRSYRLPWRIRKLAKNHIAFLRTLPITCHDLVWFSLLRTWAAALTNGILLYGGMYVLSPSMRETISPVGILTFSLLWLTFSLLWGCWIQWLEWGDGDEAAFIGVLLLYYCTLLFTVSPIYYLSGKSVFQWTLMWSEILPWLGITALIASLLLTGLTAKTLQQRLSRREW